MNEIERLRAELAAAEKEAGEANAYLAAVRAVDTKAKAPKAKREPKPKIKKRARSRIHHPESELRTSIEGYGGPAPVGSSRRRTSNRPVVTRHVDPTDRPVDNNYEGIECLYVVDYEAGRVDSDSWKRCKCAECGEIN